MNEITLTDFFTNDAPSFGSYDNVRKFPSYIDGCKLSQRKVIYTLLKKFSNPNSEYKTARLASSVAEATEYLHGEGSLCSVLDTMAANYVTSNNYPLIVGHGNFGSRFAGSGSAAAPRYTYCSIAPLTLKLFNEKDRVLFPSQMFEGTKIEPKYYVPIFPVIFLNGSDGLSTGWKSQIYPRNPKDIVKYIEAKLNKTKFNGDVRVPYFRGFKGKTKIVKNDGVVSIVNYGCVEKINTTTIHITEIPVTYSYSSYISFLDKLVEKGTIERYDDKCNPKTDVFEFIVKVKRSIFEKYNTEEELVKVFGLAKTLSEQLNVIDEDNRVREYSNIEGILDDFIKIRLEYYSKRKDHLLNSLKESLTQLASKYLFVKGIIDKTIVVANKKKDDIVAQLDKIEKIVKIDGSYEYLLRLPIHSLTKEKMEELKKQIVDGKDEYKKIKETTIEKMWIDDLEDLKKVL